MILVTAWSKFREIKAALDHEDIEGLLALGSPADEYNGEASLLESEMANVTNFGKRPVTAKQVEEILARIWSEQFGPFDDEELKKRSPAFASVARRLTGS